MTASASPKSTPSEFSSSAKDSIPMANDGDMASGSRIAVPQSNPREEEYGRNHSRIAAQGSILHCLARLRILYVEDSDLDAELVFTMAEQLGVRSAYSRARDGSEAIGLLGRGRFSLVLLDLNLPLIHGIDVLRQIRSSRDLSTLPVVVFSSSFAATDVEGAINAGASAYVVKPNSADGLRTFLEGLHAFWPHHVR